MAKAINTEQAPAAIGPYVQAMDTGSLVFTSGQLPIDPATGEMPADVAEQALQSLKNVQAIIEASGLTMNSVFKMTVFVKDLNTFGTVNEVYQKFFDDMGAGYPARSCVEVARLPKDALVEIEAIAQR
ncbi:RidA family protein [uncultured Endozoicomonas sp.]|uniref:RidA family protein n=1 Tax=uncultured Endozoicomonas sp. TaxID=432652 RepID=UPI002627F693|nr:RidA family protein [uncultured Endozoicomonas sp.]